ncbi:MAG: FecR domain-containing protein [Candidatus Xenobia bacterium]
MRRLLAMLLLLTVAAHAQMKPVAMITGIYGGMSVDRGHERLSAKIRMPLFIGDVVSTSDTSRGVLLLSDGSELKLQNSTKLQLTATKSVKVLGGEVFASMQKQKGTAFKFQTPNGNAGIEGTELDISVLQDLKAAQGVVKTTLTVAKGRVALQGKGKVDVAAGMQSFLGSGPPSLPVQVDVDPIVQWARDVKTYVEVMEQMQTLYQQLDADAQAHQGFLSPELMQQFTDAEDRIKEIVPDEAFQEGHRNMLLAFQDYKMGLAMTANPAGQQQLITQANNAYHAASLELKSYLLKYRSEVSRFLGHSF